MRFRMRPPPSANRRINQVEGPPSVLASGIDANASGVWVAIFSSMRSPSTSVRISGTPLASTGPSKPPPETATTACRPSSDRLTSGFPKKEPSGPSTKISGATNGSRAVAMTVSFTSLPAEASCTPDIDNPWRLPSPGTRARNWSSR